MSGGRERYQRGAHTVVDLEESALCGRRNTVIKYHWG